MSFYKNNARASSKGSQSETPTLRFVHNKYIVGGYQHFEISKDGVKVTGGYKGKFYYIKNFLAEKQNTCESIIDIGASNGLVSFTANELGYKDVYALDHDIECIKLVNTIKDQLDINIIAEQYSFGETHIPADIVIMAALIHWVYSCTALYGNFDEIISYVRGLTNKYLVIEWVNPNDPAIRSFKHITFNKNIIKQPYTRENFLNSLNKHFSNVQKVHSVTTTRELFLCTV